MTQKKNNNKKSATASAKYEVQQDNVHSEQSELCALSETLLPMH